MGAAHNPNTAFQQAFSTFLKAVEAPGRQKELAERTGYSEATISRFKNHGEAEKALRIFMATGLFSDPLPRDVVNALITIAEHNLPGLKSQLNPEGTHAEQQ